MRVEKIRKRKRRKSNRRSRGKRRTRRRSSNLKRILHDFMTVVKWCEIGGVGCSLTTYREDSKSLLRKQRDVDTGVGMITYIWKDAECVRGGGGGW